jgi:hypothetical protein
VVSLQVAWIGKRSRLDPQLCQRSNPFLELAARSFARGASIGPDQMRQASMKPNLLSRTGATQPLEKRPAVPQRSAVLPGGNARAPSGQAGYAIRGIAAVAQRQAAHDEPRCPDAGGAKIGEQFGVCLRRVRESRFELRLGHVVEIAPDLFSVDRYDHYTALEGFSHVSVYRRCAHPGHPEARPGGIHSRYRSETIEGTTQSRAEVPFRIAASRRDYIREPIGGDA